MKRTISAYKVYKIIFGIVLVVLFLFGIFGGLFTSESAVTNTIEKVGFTDYKITGREWFLVFLKGCSRDDQVKFNFTAKDQQGKPISGFVCAGGLKAATLGIR